MKNRISSYVFGTWKYLAKSDKYKYVAMMKNSDGKICWRANLKGGKHFETEREAALHVDHKLIKLGKDPVNILKKSSNQ